MAYVCAHHSTCEEVRGHPAGVCSLIHIVGLGGELRLSSKYLSQMSHFIACTQFILTCLFVFETWSLFLFLLTWSLLYEEQTACLCFPPEWRKGMCYHIQLDLFLLSFYFQFLGRVSC